MDRAALERRAGEVAIEMSESVLKAPPKPPRRFSVEYSSRRRRNSQRNLKVEKEERKDNDESDVDNIETIQA